MALLCVNNNKKKIALHQVGTNWPSWSTGDSIEPRHWPQLLQLHRSGIWSLKGPPCVTGLWGCRISMEPS